MFIEYGYHTYTQAPAGRHVCRIGLMHDRLTKSAISYLSSLNYHTKSLLKLSRL